MVFVTLPTDTWEGILAHVGESGVTTAQSRNPRLVCHKDITADGVAIAL